VKGKEGKKEKSGVKEMEREKKGRRKVE